MKNTEATQPTAAARSRELELWRITGLVSFRRGILPSGTYYLLRNHKAQLGRSDIELTAREAKELAEAMTQATVHACPICGGQLLDDDFGEIYCGSNPDHYRRPTRKLSEKEKDATLSEIQNVLMSRLMDADEKLGKITRLVGRGTVR